MKKQNQLFKAHIIFALVQMLSSLALTGQVNEQPHIVKPDTLIEIAGISGSDVTWDFSGVNLNTYHNTSDSDLVHGINPTTVFGDVGLNSIGDSLAGLTQEKNYAEAGITMRRHGNYVMKAEGSGTLKTSGMFYSNVQKVKLTERYFHMINESHAVTYVNTYYLFFKADTKELLFSVFNKKRNLNPFIGSEFNGIEYDKAKAFTSNPGENPLQLSLSPNPAGAQTELSYTLINNASVRIEVLNQSNTVNNLIYSGDRNAGLNHQTILLNSYSTGSYTVKVTVNEVIYATTLIVE